MSKIAQLHPDLKLRVVDDPNKVAEENFPRIELVRRQDVDNKSLTLSIAPSHLTDNCIDLRTIVSYLDTGSTVLPWHSECSTKYADTLASRIIDGVRKIKDLNSAQVQQLEEALLPKK